MGVITEKTPLPKIKPVKFLLNWGRRYSLWVFNFGLACCSIEFIAASTAKNDFIRLGVIPFAHGPRQADLLLVAGTLTDKMAPVIKRLYDQMPDPKYVISFGSCSNCGGPYWDSYSVTKGVDQVIPVDVYVPGLPAAARGAAARDHRAPAQDQGRGHPGEVPQWDDRCPLRTSAPACGRGSATPWRCPTCSGTPSPTCRAGLPRRRRVLPRRARHRAATSATSRRGVDPGEEGLQVVTHLLSTAHHHNVRVKVAPARRRPVDRLDPATCTPRATGTSARRSRCSGSGSTGHPRPVKLLLAEPFEGHPLRKDFPLMSREVKPWPGAVEGEEDEDE